MGGDGQALSKRLGALSVESFRDMGLEPMAVASHAALVGTSDAVAPRAHLTELVETFDLGKLSRSPGRFDVAELKALNAKLLHHLPYAAVADRLKAVGASGGDAFWEAVRGNLEVLADVRTWWNVVAGPVTPVVEDAALAQPRGRSAAGRALGRDHLERMDGCGQGGHRRQGAALCSIRCGLR